MKKSATGRQTGQRPIEQEADKTKSLGIDWPHVEETRWTCSQEDTGVEPTGETKERKTPANLATYENGKVGEETPHVE